MRNLKLNYSQQFNGGIKQPKFLLLNCNSTKSDDARYVVTSDKLFLFKPGSAEADSSKILAEVPDIVAAEYLSLENAICLATAGGEVLLVNLDNLEINEGTFCDVGIECMSWSPDQEVVVFVTKEHNVVAMTCTYDPLTEHPLDNETVGAEGEFVNVGWGKKETQFHGSEGKQAAKKNIDDVEVNVAELSNEIFVDWRADSAYFVVSYTSQVRGRTFKVFDKEGKLQYVAEKQPNLGAAIAYRPCGTWIAIPQRLPNKSCIALFEKNGLRHRELVLPFDLQNEPVESLKWSLDSEILCLKTQNNLYMYTINNYHWYLKQVLEFSSDKQVNHFQWDNRFGEEKTLHILLDSGKYLIYKWHWAVDRFDRTGLAYVIDGRRLLITDFERSVIPPPMCSQEILLQSEAFIASVLLQREENMYILFLYDSQHHIHMYKAFRIPYEEFNFTKELVIKPLDGEDDLIPLEYATMQFFADEPNNHMVVYSTVDNVTSIKFFNTDTREYKVHSKFNIPGTIYTLAHASDDKPGELFFQMLEDGNVMQTTFDLRQKKEKDRRLHAKIESSIEHLHCLKLSSAAETLTIALTSNQCLFINNKRYAEDVTSFCLAGNYLAYTKFSSLHFLRWSDLCLVNERRLERGSKLVTTVQNSARTILQMPRGNLEAICPRVLSLELVGNFLTRQQYRLAFDILRKERINLNILCDHDMCRFIKNLDSFFEQIQNPNWLCLFLTDLQNEDFTKTMYASNYEENSQVYPEGFKIENKVAFLCKALCNHMEQSSEKCYRLPILTAYVKMGELEKALELIWEDKKKDDSSGADDALKYLLYLVDVNQLYNVALGTYDFGLVLFVAQKSQKDPKEYLAFLNELKSFELNYRKFKIDEYLKRYEKALKHIANCGKEKFEEALEFIKKHEYYVQGMKAFKNDNNCYKVICLAFADYLREKGKFETASILYERGFDLQQALLSAKHVLDWQRVLILAQEIDPETTKTVAKSLISPLQAQGKYLEAYQVARSYADSFNTALESLFAGKLFLKAIYEINLQEDNQIQEAVLLPKLLNYHEELSQNLTNEEAQFLKHKERLLEIRVLRSKQAQKLLDSEEDIDECDLLSDTTSMRSSRYTASSRGTGKTFRSSKNRRKHERKLLSFKPGNPFEDIAYIDALYNQIATCFKQQQHIHDTCKALILCNYDDLAAELHKQLKKLLNLMQNSLDEIWIPEMMTITAAQQFLQGPNIDYTQLRNEQRYAMMDPQKRLKPQLTLIDWEYDILY